ncbi:MAG: tetratricopeptide repeat protein [Candidatus Delongbacteria bacterium]|nr:tetratricopeptide repeat protein [Candidatus Delongbacteria bacterium]MBN2834223.1 tetratricopeptide repeat protein [Candidatus Delongbacteria bacterium]
MQKNVKTLVKIVLFISIISLTSCVYYNMYFNGNKHFNDGEKKLKEKRLESSSSVDDFYEKSIKELSKILEFYPESDWVDDALLLMGRCYYRLRSYERSERKYIELLTNYPESELIDQAKIWLCETEIKLGKFDELREYLSEIKPDSTDSEGMKIYLKLLAEMRLSQKDTSEAYNYFSKASKYVEDDEELIDILERKAYLAETHGLSREAERDYYKLSTITESRKDKVRYFLRLGELLQERGHTDSALEIYNDLLADVDYEAYISDVEFSIAKIKFINKDYDKAVDKFDELLRTYRKGSSNDSILAEASFYMAEYYLLLKKDLDKAASYYDSVKYYYAKTKSFEKSQKRSKSIFSVNKYAREIKNYLYSEDSLNLKIAEFNNELYEISDEDKQEKLDEIQLMERKIKKIRDETVRNYFNISDLLITELSTPDSAIRYLKGGSNYDDYPHYSSRCLLLLAELENSNKNVSDSLKNIILEKYPRTLAANRIRIEQNLPTIDFIEDTLSYLFDLASESILKDEFEMADSLLTKLMFKSQDHEIYPKVVLSLALLNEMYIHNGEKALNCYNILKRDFPRDSEGLFAINKLRADDEPVKEIEATKENRILDEFEIWKLMDRRLE